MKKQTLLFLISSLFFTQLLAMDELPDQLYCSDENETVYVTFSKGNPPEKTHFHVRNYQKYDFYGNEISLSNENSLSVSKKVENKVLIMTLLIPPNFRYMAYFDAHFQVSTSYVDAGSTLANDPNLAAPKITKLLCSRFL